MVANDEALLPQFWVDVIVRCAKLIQYGLEDIKKLSVGRRNIICLSAACCLFQPLFLVFFFFISFEEVEDLNLEISEQYWKCILWWG